jgi:hypothetical protein
MLRILRRTLSLRRSCSVCAGPARYGYSEQAETELQHLTPMCLGCLTEQLRRDYRAFEGDALVVQPAAGPPVYVFQPVAEWARCFPNSGITSDVTRLVAVMNRTCCQCGSHACFLWIESAGLTERNFGDVLETGVGETLLKNNPEPVSLCPECCVARICDALAANGNSYIEVCSPRGSGLGFVLPMGY